MANNAAKIAFCLTKNNFLAAKQYFLTKQPLICAIIATIAVLLCQVSKRIG